MRARRAENVAAGVQDAAPRARGSPSAGKKRDEIQRLSKAADRKATRAVKGGRAARGRGRGRGPAARDAAAERAAQGDLEHADARGGGREANESGARRRRRDKKKSEGAAEENTSPGGALRAVEGKEPAPSSGRRRRAPRAHQKGGTRKGEDARRTGLRVRAATAELVARAAMDASVKAVLSIERAVAAIHAADRSKDRARPEARPPRGGFRGKLRRCARMYKGSARRRRRRSLHQKASRRRVRRLLFARSRGAIDADRPRRRARTRRSGGF